MWMRFYFLCERDIQLCFCVKKEYQKVEQMRRRVKLFVCYGNRVFYPIVWTIHSVYEFETYFKSTNYRSTGSVFDFSSFAAAFCLTEIPFCCFSFSPMCKCSFYRYVKVYYLSMCFVLNVCCDLNAILSSCFVSFFTSVYKKGERKKITKNQTDFYCFCFLFFVYFYCWCLCFCLLSLLFYIYMFIPYRALHHLYKPLILWAFVLPFRRRYLDIQNLMISIASLKDYTISHRHASLLCSSTKTIFGKD